MDFKLRASKLVILSIASLILGLFYFMLPNHAAAELYLTRLKVAGMTIGGPYAGLITAPFAGVALYANGDYAKTSYVFPTVPGNYRIEIRGASSNNSMAGVAIYVDGVKQTSLAFATPTPGIQSAIFNLSGKAGSKEIKLVLETDNGTNDTYLDYVDLFFQGGSSPQALPTPPSIGAFSTGIYRNLFKERGYSNTDIQNKLNTAWNQLFYGDDNQRIYYPVSSDMAYIKDIDNTDVRSEGMSYGMMIAVQLNKQAEFNRLWKWAKAYMQHQSGPRQGYFAWQCDINGNKLDVNPASDGEEYFAMSLFFAAGRWGNGAGIYNYQAEAQLILDTMLHKEANGIIDSVTNMFNQSQKLVVFVPYASAATFTDPSYQLPAFYELWARWANKDNQFWTQAATSSRQFLKNTVNPVTGLAPDYSEFSGAANNTGGHNVFRFDAWRVSSNIAVDYAWHAADPWAKLQSDRLLNFFANQGIKTYPNQYTLEGLSLSSDHSPGLVAMNAVAGLAATTDKTWNFVDELWNSSVPSGQWRYYDGILYLLGLLHTSGNFKIYSPNQLDSMPTAGALSPTPVFSPTRTPNSTVTAATQPTTATPTQGNLPAALPTVTTTATSVPISTPTPTATPGQATTNNTGFLRPNAQGSEPGGNNNGFELNPAEALTSNNSFAVDAKSGTNNSTSCTDPGKDKHSFAYFDVSLPAGASVKGIEVRLDAKVANLNGSSAICAQLSWDNGKSWTAPKMTSALQTFTATYLLGGANSNWGRSWSNPELSNGNFKVRVTNVASTTGQTFYLDWIGVKVYS
jgi:endo-1,4-beta-D-glucanase Y